MLSFGQYCAASTIFSSEIRRTNNSKNQCFANWNHRQDNKTCCLLYKADMLTVTPYILSMETSLNSREISQIE